MEKWHNMAKLHEAAKATFAAELKQLGLAKLDQDNEPTQTSVADAVPGESQTIVTDGAQSSKVRYLDYLHSATVL